MARAPAVQSYDPRAWAAVWTVPGTERRDAGGPRRKPIAVFAAAAAVAVLAAGAAALSLAGRAPAPAASVAADGSAEPDEPGVTRRTFVLTSPGELQGALVEKGLPVKLAADIARQAAPALTAQGKIRAVLTLAQGAPGAFRQFEATNLDSSGVRIAQLDSGELQAVRIAASIVRQTFVKAGVMDGDSFYSSAVAVGVPNNIIPEFAKAMAFDFNFQTEVAAGDAFELAYSQPVNAAKEAVGPPQLIYASLTTAAKSARVYRFRDEKGQVAWFDSSGQSIASSFMRTPVDGARVSSKFGMRFHPTLHYTRLHGGVDFAAPVGTPIYASADGVVLATGASATCAGNRVMMRHKDGYETHYFHMVRIAEGMPVGSSVTQGTTIGYVGMTGGCVTGPHLHYEVVINGEKVDPLTIKTDSGRKSLTGPLLLEFERTRDAIDKSREGQSA